MDSTAIRLGTQAWMPRPHSVAPPEPDRIMPVQDVTLFSKPRRGGFWTSSWDGQTSGWIEWCRSESVRWLGDDVWLLEPDPAARIAMVDSLPDLIALLDRYPTPPRYPDSRLLDRNIDFDAMALDFDAMHLTEEGQWRTRMTMPDSLYGWDCESTLWFRWGFTGTPRKIAVANRSG